MRQALAPERYRVIEHTALREDELRLTASAVDACVFDADLTSIEPIRQWSACAACFRIAP